LRAALGIALIFPMIFLTGCADIERARLNSAYKESISASAIKTPDFETPLHAIDVSKPAVTVATFQDARHGLSTKNFIWVAQAYDLAALCRGRTDPQVAVEEAVGLPPGVEPSNKVFVFNVSPKSLFRPCASGAAVSTPTCSLKVPERVNTSDKDVEHFVLKQMMASYTNIPGETPYPFTAMGWSYNWNPDSSDHHGVSEYVVRRGAKVAAERIFDPAEFCAADWGRN
jgi:hypothetical protein